MSAARDARFGYPTEDGTQNGTITRDDIVMTAENETVGEVRRDWVSGRWMASVFLGRSPGIEAAPRMFASRPDAARWVVEAARLRKGWAA
jgi:hypothetical protein